MRHAPISIAAATAIFVLGVFIINIQVWYSARADSLAGAHYVVRNMHVILTEAHHATQVAMRLAENECDAEGQYRLGTEAALQPHLRTIVILKKMWSGVPPCRETACCWLTGQRCLKRHCYLFHRKVRSTACRFSYTRQIMPAAESW